MSVALAGLSIIALAWLFQLVSTWSGRGGMRRSFVLLYGLGAAVMVIATADQGFTPESWLNLVILLIVALIFLKVHR